MTEDELSSEDELSTEDELLTEEELSTEDELLTEEELSTEDELLTEEELSTEDELSTEEELPSKLKKSWLPQEKVNAVVSTMLAANVNFERVLLIKELLFPLISTPPNLWEHEAIGK